MNSVYFYRRKYNKDVVNCWFSVRDGEKLISLDACNVGDEVALMWDIDGGSAGKILRDELGEYPYLREMLIEAGVIEEDCAGMR